MMVLLYLNVEMLLTAVFLVFFLWLALLQSKKIDLGLPAWAPPAYLAIKFVVGYVLFLIFTLHYPKRADADIFKYFDDAMVLFDYMRLETSSIIPIMLKSDLPVELAPRMKSWFSGGGFNLFDSSQVMVKLHVVLRLFSFGIYHVHSMFFCFLSFAGCMFFIHVVRKAFRVDSWVVLACFCFPSFLLWSSAPLKESIAVWLILLSTGYFVVYLKNHHRINLLLSLVVLMPLYSIKPFYVLVLLVSLLMVLMNKSGSFKLLFVHIICLVGFLWLADFILSSYSPIEILARKQRDYFDHFEWQSARSMSGIQALEPSMTGLVKLLPDVLTNVFLKPLPWESLNALYLASSLENMVVLGLLALTLVFLKKNADPFTRRVLILMMSFFLMTYLLLGYSCPVIGSLMRFKSPVLVFVPLAFVLTSRLFSKPAPMVR